MWGGNKAINKQQVFVVWQESMGKVGGWWEFWLEKMEELACQVGGGLI